MLSQIFAALKVLGELLKFWKWGVKKLSEARTIKRAEDSIERQDAIDDSKLAQTDEEIFAAQQRIVNSRPK